MGYQEINSLDTDTVVSLGGTNKKTNKANPTRVEGYYLGKRSIEDRKKKSGVGYIYVFQTPKGNIGVWGKTNLDNKMGDVEPGVMVRVTFTGMKATPNGEMYVYKVEQDKDNTIEVTAQEDEAQEESDYSTDGALSAGAFDEETEDEGYAAAAPSAGAAERSARVQELLKSRKAAVKN